jgi:hypothetical protein
MPTKTWEPPPRQTDTEAGPHESGSAEPRNFETPRRDRGRNPDASSAELGQVDYDEINLHGSER